MIFLEAADAPLFPIFILKALFANLFSVSILALRRPPLPTIA
jgi:hypothetical protein